LDVRAGKVQRSVASAAKTWGEVCGAPCRVPQHSLDILAAWPLLLPPCRIDADGWPTQGGQEITVKSGQRLVLTTRGAPAGRKATQVLPAPARLPWTAALRDSTEPRLAAAQR
jgi:hypothetical protein